jgi:hypothetical protein
MTESWAAIAGWQVMETAAARSRKNLERNEKIFMTIPSS